MKKIFSTRTFNLTRINQCWHFFESFWKAKVPKKKMFQGFQSRKMVKIDSSSQKNILFSSEHQEYTFNNLFRNTSPKKNKWFSAAKIGKSRCLKRIEKRKFFREKFFFHEIVPLDTQSTLPTPLTIIFLRISQIPNQNPQLTRKVRFMKKIFPKDFCRTVECSFVIPPENFTT